MSENRIARPLPHNAELAYPTHKVGSTVPNKFVALGVSNFGSGKSLYEGGSQPEGKPKLAKGWRRLTKGNFV